MLHKSLASIAPSNLRYIYFPPNLYALHGIQTQNKVPKETRFIDDSFPRLTAKYGNAIKPSNGRKPCPHRHFAEKPVTAAGS